LCVEYKRVRNGEDAPMGKKLIGAMAAHGLDAMGAVEKLNMQMLAARGGPYTEEQQKDLLVYCESDVRALEKLLPAMLPKLDVPRALFRGKYMAGVSAIEFNGVPIDEPSYQKLSDNWNVIRNALIEETNRDVGVWVGDTFKEAKFEEWLKERRIPWPKLNSGRLCLQKDVFARMAEEYPEVEPLRALRNLLSQLRDFELPIGPDGRARCMSGSFNTITGRNAPAASEFIFAWPGWCRGLIVAPAETVLLSLDFAAEEFLIAGVLSGDEQIVSDYRNGDCYLEMGKQLGIIPPDGTKQSHPNERATCKIITLAANYGMAEISLAAKLRKPTTVATDLLRRHRMKYEAFWKWSDASVNFARANRWLRTKYGWTVFFPPDGDPATRTWRDTTLRNWRVQATGGEVLRATVCALDAAGLKILATVHDSVLLELPLVDWQARADLAVTTMQAASVAILGEPLRVDVKVIQPGERLLDAGKARDTWNRFQKLIQDTPRLQLFETK
jgi:hypothetical protein